MNDAKSGTAEMDAIADALSNVNFSRLKKLAESDSSIKDVLKIVDACRHLVGKKSRKKKTSWNAVAKTLVKKIMTYDPLRINFVNEKRKDGTWCMWLTWEDVSEIGTKSGYSLISECTNSRMHEEAAKSFVENFCSEGPKCVEIYFDSCTSTRQRNANAAVVATYKELGCPKTPELVKDELNLKAL